MDLYTDPREAELAAEREAAEKAGAELNDWSQEKLESVVNSKEKDNQTDIVCKFFVRPFCVCCCSVRVLLRACALNLCLCRLRRWKRASTAISGSARTATRANTGIDYRQALY